MLTNPYTNPAQANKDSRLLGVQYIQNPGAEYERHIRNTGCICNTSASHTYGNVLATIEKWLIDLFPENLFKTVIASTTLVSRQIRHTPTQLRKKQLPIMVLVPRVIFGQEENRFLGHTLMNDRYTNTHAVWGDGSLLPLAEDPRKKIYIHGHYNRAVMYVDVVLNFDTQAQQINYMSYIDNMLAVGHNKFIKAPLELYIPGEFCNLISRLCQIPVRDEKKESVYDFLTYMNTIWNYPITYKLKGGSNTDEFFMYYLADIDVVVQDPQPGPGVKDGQIRRGFDISFTVRCDFNTIGYFTLNSPDLEKPINITPADDGMVIPLFSDVINLQDFALPIGWKILSWPIFKLDYGSNKISIENVLNDSLRTVIDYHLKFGIPMDKFIKFQFRENGQILNDEAFYIDWIHRELIILQPNYRRTYRLIITVSIDYINRLIKELYELE